MPTASISLKQRASDPTSKSNWQASPGANESGTKASAVCPACYRLHSRAIAPDRAS
jgi:hypothetical protein